jgi:hypothetical protein
MAAMALPGKPAMRGNPIRKGGGKPGPSDRVPALLTPGETVIPRELSEDALAPLVALFKQQGELSKQDIEQYLYPILSNLQAEEGEEGEMPGFSGGGLVGLLKEMIHGNPNVAQTKREVAQMKAGTYQGQPEPTPAPAMGLPAPGTGIQQQQAEDGIHALAGRKGQIDRAVREAEGYALGGEVANKGYVPDYEEQFMGTASMAKLGEKKRYDEWKGQQPQIGIDMTNWKAENPDLVVGKPAAKPNPQQMTTSAEQLGAAINAFGQQQPKPAPNPSGTMSGTRTMLQNPGDPFSTATRSENPSYAIDAQGNASRSLGGKTAMMPPINTVPAGVNALKPGSNPERAMNFATGLKGDSFLGKQGQASAAQKLDAYNRMMGASGEDGTPAMTGGVPIRTNVYGQPVPTIEEPSNWQMQTGAWNASIGTGASRKADMLRYANLAEQQKQSRALQGQGQITPDDIMKNETERQKNAMGLAELQSGIDYRNRKLGMEQARLNNGDNGDPSASYLKGLYTVMEEAWKQGDTVKQDAAWQEIQKVMPKKEAGKRTITKVGEPGRESFVDENGQIIPDAFKAQINQRISDARAKNIPDYETGKWLVPYVYDLGLNAPDYLDPEQFGYIPRSQGMGMAIK